MTPWFLPAGHPGSPDEWCFQTIPTSEIRVHVSFESYCDRLAQLFSQAKKNDEIFIVGFDLVLERILSLQHKDFPLLLTWLESARGRGARVRLLFSPSNSIATENNDQAVVALQHGLDAMVDLQLPAGAAHHQKAVFIKLESSSHLFVGGMDLARGRREWFDVQAEIIGPGANLGRKTLEERWESVKPQPGRISATQQIVPTGQTNAHQVQFVRTYPPFPKDTTGWTRTYAKDGDHTYYALLCRAITNAKESIYLEEQFFQTMAPAPQSSGVTSGTAAPQRSDLPSVPDTIERLLRDAIGRNVRVVVVAANKTRPIPPPDRAARDTLVKSLASATNPPVLLQVLPDVWFVHSKTWIFDDQFVLIGSGNLWPNSLLSIQQPAESEFGVAFTSTADGAALGFPKARFGRALRIRLWERLKQNRDPKYVFPRNLSTSFDDEVQELRRPVGKTAVFENMS